ncbi:MAG: alpha/beta hydrolase-fold protein [Gammaproteobacteria bacterium]
MQSRTIAVALLGLLLSAGCEETPSDEHSEGELISYFSTMPVVDGQLDKHLARLPKRHFGHKFTFDNPDVPPVNVTYRMAYSSNHLYLYIETDTDKISYHRRGYLWGDGYSLLLGIPQTDRGTNEYYEIGYSPTLEPDYEWDRQRIAVYNFQTPTTKLSASSSSQEAAFNGKTGFEALIAWDDLLPYHPWMLEEIGFNLYFAKGFDTQENGYLTNGYAVVEDEGIWDEEIEFRAMRKMRFEVPQSLDNDLIQIAPVRNNVSAGQIVEVRVVSGGKEQSTETVKLNVTDSDEHLVSNKILSIDYTQKLTEQRFKLQTSELKPGLYSIELMLVDQKTAVHTIGILPKIDFKSISEHLSAGKPNVSLGAVQTLQFHLQELNTQLVNLKRYEDGRHIFTAWRKFSADYEQFLEDIDPYANKTGPYRRGFKSDLDGTYQPYTIRLPENYNPDKSYPLLVFLHGSGQDEQKLLNKKRSNGNFIELAPYGRDRFQAYASPESQIDIVEAINNVAAFFPVDKDKVVIGGFSMGGYGAMRAFYENPTLYQGIAVFAGHPNLASEWLGEEHPNFRDAKYLLEFSGQPVFIYHGIKDAALDVKLMQETAVELESAGAMVTTSWPEDKGHEYQDDLTNALYADWLDQIVIE